MTDQPEMRSPAGGQTGRANRKIKQQQPTNSEPTGQEQAQRAAAKASLVALMTAGVRDEAQKEPTQGLMALGHEVSA